MHACMCVGESRVGVHVLVCARMVMNLYARSDVEL